MQIQYSFMGNSEPTDEQLHLLMNEVVIDVKERAKKSEKAFLKQLHKLVQNALNNQLKDTNE